MQENNNTPQKPQLTPEQIKQLMSMMQAKQPTSLSKRQEIMMKVLKKVSEYLKVFIHNMDRFINFVVKDKDIDRNDVVQTARGPVLFGTYVIIIFVVFGGLWSALAPLDKASVAVGTIIPNSKRKTVQHPTGGTIKEIYVQLGDKVKEGDKIIALDDVRFKGEYEIALNNYRTALANESRLIAERDDKDTIEFDPFLTSDAANPQVSSLLSTQRELFEKHRSTMKKELEIHEKNLEKSKKELEIYITRKEAAHKNDEVWKAKLKSAEEIFKKGIINKTQFLELESNAFKASSDLIGSDAQIAAAEQSVAQAEAQVLQASSKQLGQILTDLHEAQRQKNDAKEKYVSAKDAYDHAILRSPVDGTVIEMYQTTIGGVIGQGSPVADILPANDHLIIEARVANKDIDAVTIGLKTKIRFSAFKSRTSPVFTGTVVSLSPDVVMDKQNSMMQQQGAAEGHSYIAKIEIDMEEFNRISKGRLVLRPGMQAEVQIITGERTLLQYLLDPVTDNMFKAFKEK